MLTVVWLAVLAIATLGILLLVWQRQGKSLLGRRRPELPSLRRTVFNLQLGDIVQYDGSDWVVEGKLTYDSHGFIWLEYLLQDGDRIRWLSVEEDDVVEVQWLKPMTGVDISGDPPKQLTVGGITYQQDETGTARMTHLGTTLNRQAQTCRYYDYTSANNQVLSVENWDGEMEVTAGDRIRPIALSLLPGDGDRVYGV